MDNFKPLNKSQIKTLEINEKHDLVQENNTEIQCTQETRLITQIENKKTLQTVIINNENLS